MHMTAQRRGKRLRSKKQREEEQSALVRGKNEKKKNVQKNEKVRLDILLYPRLKSVDTSLGRGRRIGSDDQRGSSRGRYFSIPRKKALRQASQRGEGAEYRNPPSDAKACRARRSEFEK